MIARFVVYGLLGWGIEIVWTALGSAAVARRLNPRLVGTTYLWMFPIYGLLAIFYEPAHNMMRAWPWFARGIVYGVGFMAVEYASGWAIRRFSGVCPWDYTGRCRWHLHGLVRLDYFPAWVLLGFALEPVHDFLVRLTPYILAAL